MTNRYYRGPASDHFDDTRFFNPGQPTTDRTLADLLRWRFSGQRRRWADHDAGPLASPCRRVDGLQVTMVGHASVLIQMAGHNISAGIAFDTLPPIHLVLITHNHYDHLDAPSLRRLWARDRPRIITALGTDAVIARAMPGCRAQAGDVWPKA